MKNRISSEIIISQVLRWGVVASAAIILFGVVLMLARQNTLGAAWDLDSLLAFSPGAPPFYFPRDVATVLSQAVTMQPFAVIELGLLLLIAIPVLRVVTSLVLFALAKDKPYVLITTLVLAVLLISFLVVR